MEGGFAFATSRLQLQVHKNTAEEKSTSQGTEWIA